ncbi:MAG: DUF4281 domain-containing protein [Alphaproteobacteria bacterium]|nr:DUF4281 domain-containing protein [Alphaproteobacteria bacterium]
MTADLAFSIVNPVALVGWLVLAAGVIWAKPLLRDVIAGAAMPIALSGFYVVLIGAFFFKADGGFDTLAHVQLLFTNKWAALAGWVHYLAFDLMTGAIVAREVMRLGISRLFLIVLLPLTFMFGPAGYFAFMILRLAFSKTEISA